MENFFLNEFWLFDRLTLRCNTYDSSVNRRFSIFNRKQSNKLNIGNSISFFFYFDIPLDVEKLRWEWFSARIIAYERLKCFAAKCLRAISDFGNHIAYHFHWISMTYPFFLSLTVSMTNIKSVNIHLFIYSFHFFGYYYFCHTFDGTGHTHTQIASTYKTRNICFENLRFIYMLTL